MDVFDVNWKTVAEFLLKYPLLKAFWSRRLVVFSTLLDFNDISSSYF